MKKIFGKENKKGIGFLEVIIVIAILGIITAIAVPQFAGIKKTQSLKNAGEDIISTLYKAKTQTLASLDSSEYGVYFEANQIILFKGKVYVPNDPNNKGVAITSPVTISDISLGGGAELYFNKLTGAPNHTGTITISLADDASTNKVITISATGTASLN